MNQFTPKEFNIPQLLGISEKTITEHLGLYSGYVKNANLILSTIQELSTDAEKHAYEISELQRRFGFEFCGMRNHEHYFAALVGGAQTLSETSALHAQIVVQWGSYDAWLTRFKTLAMTRGVGWAMLYWDSTTQTLVHAWVDEQQLGQLADCKIILALDMWEHSFVADYQPSGKKQYVEDFFKNVNWGVIEKVYESILT